MRVGVIRNDLSAPLLLADLEQVSRRNTPVDAPGQVRYLGFTTDAQIAASLADSTTGAGATITGSDISGSLPLTLVAATSDDLRLRTAPGDAFTVVSIAAAAYSTIDALVAAINTALASTTLNVQAFNGGNSNVVLESTLFGVDSYLENDTEANGSNANSELGLANGSTRDMPAASAFSAAIGIPGGLDVSQATLEAVGAGDNSNALEPHYDAGLTRGGAALADLVAPQFAETDVAVESFLVGMLSELASANFNPDSRNSASVVGAAIAVVEDDGATAFATANTLPVLTTADLDTPGAGDLTITGTGLGKESGGATDPLRSTSVKLTGDGAITLHQEEIEAGGGTISDTSIFIPAALIPGAATTTTSAQVQFRQRVTAVVALT